MLPNSKVVVGGIELPEQLKNDIKDACSTADIIDCLWMAAALSLELFDYCSVGSG